MRKTKNITLAASLHVEVKKLEKARAKINSKINNPLTYKIWYVRYADDFIIGIRGSQEQAKMVWAEAKKFLVDRLKLEVSEEKTLITNVKKGKAMFLGAHIKCHWSRTSDAPQTKRAYSGLRTNVRLPSFQMRLLAPIETIVKILEDQGVCRIVDFRNRNIIPQKKSAWVNLELHEIVRKYAQVWTGILNYYSFAWNRCQLNLIQYLLQHSAACTIMNKLKLGSRRQVFRKFGERLTIPYKGSNRDLASEFPLQGTLARTNRFNVQPLAPFEIFYWNLRTKSKLDNPCVICESNKNVEMHHVKSLKDGKNDNTFHQVMININRKQIPVCRTCHLKIHKGEYDGPSLKELKDKHTKKI